MKRGYMLLEVVVAVGILVVAMAYIGMQVHEGVRAAWHSERTLRTLLLAESKLAELDAGLIVPEEEIEAEFGPVFPDYGWRLRMEPTGTPELNFITLEVLYQPRQSVKEEFLYDEAEVIQKLYTLRGTPRALDLTRDFGMSEEEADKLTEKLSGVGGRGLDPRSLSPAVLAELDLEELIKVAPPLLEAFGMSMDEFKQMLPPELQQMWDEAMAEFNQSRQEGAGPSSSGSGGGSTGRGSAGRGAGGQGSGGRGAGGEGTVGPGPSGGGAGRSGGSPPPPRGRDRRRGTDPQAQ